MYLFVIIQNVPGFTSQTAETYSTSKNKRKILFKKFGEKYFITKL